MIIMPAVDVLDHKVVQLVGGEIENPQITLPDPLNVALAWVERGFAPYLHLVDLDGAFGRGDNTDIFKQIIQECGVPVQIGGGIRTTKHVDDLISYGADKVIVGTKAIKEPEWLSGVADKHPGKIVVGMDTKNGNLAVNGWQGASDMSVETMFEIVRDLPLGGVLNTNVTVEGQMKGINREQSEYFIKHCPQKVISSGGITTREDCELLSKLGAVGAVVGLAAYTERIKPWDWDPPWFVD